MHIIVVYAPTESNSTDETRSTFYDNLSGLVRKIPKGDTCFILGDFNARTGCDREGLEEQLGRNGMDTRNNNGELLLGFAKGHDMSIINTFFDKKKPQATFYGPDKSWRRLDYILTFVRDRKMVIDCETKNTTDEMADHKYLQATVLTRPCKMKREKEDILPEINRQVRDPTTKEMTTKWKNELQTVFKGVIEEEEKNEEKEEVEKKTGLERYKIFLTKFSDISRSCLGDKKKQSQTDFMNNNKINPILEAARKEERISYKVYLSTGGDKQHLSYTLYKRCRNKLTRIREKAAMAKMKTELTTLQKQFESKDSNDTHLFHKVMKKLGLEITLQSPNPAIKDANGVLLHDQKAQMKRFAEYTTKLFKAKTNSNVDYKQIEEMEQLDVCHSLARAPTMLEMEEAINSLKNNKATGPDRISIELLKNIIIDENQAVKNYLHKVIVQNWEEETVPVEWRSALIKMLFKKGDKTSCDNYRTISLLSHVGKIPAKIIAKRLAKYLERIKQLPESQCAFREGRSTLDMIYIARMLCEMGYICNKDIYTCYIDLKKAYDSVDRKALWMILKKFGVPDKLINIVRKFHDGMTAQICGGGRLSEHVPMEVGLRQGCIMAPLLFNVYLAAIVIHVVKDLKADGGDVGIPINTFMDIDPLADDVVQKRNNALKKMKKKMGDGENTNAITNMVWIMLFADDAGNVSHDVKDLERMVQSFFRNAAKFGQIGSVPKTEFTHQQVRKSKNEKRKIEEQQIYIPPPQIKLGDGQEIKQTDKFKYLGSIFCTDFENRINADVSRRIMLARRAFNSLYHRCFKRKLSLSIKINVFKVYVITTLLYGSETWTTNVDIFRRLESTQLSMLLTIFRKTRRDHIRYIDLLAKTGMNCVEAEQCKRQLRFVGQIERMEDHRLPKQVFYGDLKDGKRSQGGQITSWAKNLKQCMVKFDIQEDWRTFAQRQIDWTDHINKSGIDYFMKTWTTDKEEKYQEKKRKEREREKETNSSPIAIVSCSSE
jgi:hypothetical protein